MKHSVHKQDKTVFSFHAIKIFLIRYNIIKWDMNFEHYTYFKIFSQYKQDITTEQIVV